ncbi:MAG: cell division protein ZapB [Treponema sp.]|jgi:predicted RNase H-like nuclease (RuvC/YqgF family)|nr:cell division protein ZapB [Treponema sp.]
MGTLEHVRVLETKVVKALDFVKRITEENTELKAVVESYQKRINELEALIQQFKEDQGRIENGILSALNRLNQFEDAMEKSLSDLGSTVQEASDTVDENVESPEASKGEGTTSGENHDSAP